MYNKKNIDASMVAMQNLITPLATRVFLRVAMLYGIICQISDASPLGLMYMLSIPRNREEVQTVKQSVSNGKVDSPPA